MQFEDLNQISIFDGNTEDESENPVQQGGEVLVKGSNAPEYIPPKTVTVPAQPENPFVMNPEPTNNSGKQLEIVPEFDRKKIVDFINSQGYLTYFVRYDRINDYLKSLLDLADLLTHNLVYQNARDDVIDDVIGLIRGYIDELHKKGLYDDLASKVLEFKLLVNVFDPFGKAIDEINNDFTLFSENDLDRQLRNADAKLGNYGFQTIYGRKYYDEDDPNRFKIDCILFAADDNCRAKLGEYAKKKLNEFVGKYRLAIVNKSDACKKKYHDILADSDIVSEQIFAIPESIVVREEPDGTEYENHLLASEKTGIAKIKLNGWEADLIKEESQRNDFICWLRNPSRASWALCLPYEIGGQKKAFYPDFLVVRSDLDLDYIVDILEPHGDQYADNFPKAKALAEYAKKEDRIGRIQLIHKSTDVSGKSKFVRLDLTDMTIREKVLCANNDDELKSIFTVDGKFE